jgi:hypothetical protein
MADWKISRRRGACAACERDFDDGERHVSTLRVNAEGLERADLCLAWWNAAPAEASGEACRGACQERVEAGAEGPTLGEDLFWWATRFQAERRQTVQLDLESLQRLFLELEGTEDGRLQELRYVLCLILMRKRYLKVERVLRTADGEAFRVKRPRRDERYEVRVFDFTPERMAQIRTELQAIFDGAETVEGVDLTDTPVEETGTQPEETGTQPEETGTQPEETGTQPEETGTQPEAGEPAPAGEGSA